MATEVNRAITTALLTLLRPLVRILLRNGMSFGVFSDLARQVFVDVAEKEFAITGRKQSVSRVSVLTGLSRKEVVRLQKESQAPDAALTEDYNRAARVIGGWVRHGAYVDERGRPLSLPMQGDEPSFNALVKRFSGDIPARAILDELLRVGAVERLKDGRLRLLKRAYVPQTGEVEKIGILGTDVAYLADTIDHNLKAPEAAFFQRKVSYDNLSQETVADFRPLAANRGQELLEFLDAWLSMRDRDITPEAGGSGRKRAGLGVYYFEEDLDKTDSGDSD